MPEPYLITDDFLLANDTARALYHGVAQGFPLIDFHCHIAPGSLNPAHRFLDITSLWVASDPYKHRAMRINGINEDEITGSADARVKFRRWLETLDRLWGNPLFHWSYLEMARFFAIDGKLDPAKSDELFDELNEKIAAPDFNSAKLLSSVRAKLVVTSDTLCDELATHRTFGVENYRVAPSLRADEILAFEADAFGGFLASLEMAGGNAIRGLDDFMAAIATRLDFFHAAGCRVADHSLDAFAYENIGAAEAATLFDRLLAKIARKDGGAVEPWDAIRLRSFVLQRLGAEYRKRGWLLLLHLGAQRATSSRLRRLVGPAGGYAAIGATLDVRALVAFLDDLERADALPKTALFTLNPADNAVLATLTGSFAEDGVPGKIQFGPAWWYNDHRMGMAEHLRTLAAHGILERFIGMTTDSRSILSLSRHEYFRRVFCDFIGSLVEAGELPRDETTLHRMVRAVCYQNARNWLSGEEMV